MDLHERVRYLRKEIEKKSQAEFAAMLGTSRDAINNLEGNRLKRPDQKEPLLRLMCAKCNVREKWLMEGDGDPREPLSRAAQITQRVGEAMAEAEPSDRRNLLAAVCDATPEELAAIVKFARRLVAEYDAELSRNNKKADDS